jgi:hypothetical protein
MVISHEKKFISYEKCLFNMKNVYLI